MSEAHRPGKGERRCHICGRVGKTSGMWTSADPGLQRSGRATSCANAAACDRRVARQNSGTA